MIRGKIARVKTVRLWWSQYGSSYTRKWRSRVTNEKLGGNVIVETCVPTHSSKKYRSICKKLYDISIKVYTVFCGHFSILCSLCFVFGDFVILTPVVTWRFTHYVVSHLPRYEYSVLGQTLLQCTWWFRLISVCRGTVWIWRRSRNVGLLQIKSRGSHSKTKGT